MNSLLIGIVTGLLTVLLLHFPKSLNRPIIYGLILSGIGFLYVGFTWSDITQLIVTIVQAVVFVFLAYFGIKKNIYILIGGYFLHGLWDLGYSYVVSSELLPPHYDFFCLAVDFIMGGYLLFFWNRFTSPESKRTEK